MSEIGEDHGVPIDPLAAQQVEVIRGPATLRWGSQAIGGVVSVTNNRIPEAVPRDVYSLETKAPVSSVDNGLEGSAMLDVGKGNFAFHADAYGRSADDYRIPSYPYLFPEAPAPVVGSRQPNSAMRSDGQAVGGSYLFDGGFVGVVGVAVRQPLSHARAGSDRDQHPHRHEADQGDQQRRIPPVSRSAIDAIRFWFGATDYKHDEIANEGGFERRAADLHQQGAGRPRRGPAHAVRPALGHADHRDRRAGRASAAHGAGLCEGGLFDPNRTNSVAGFAFNEFRFTDTLRMQVAGRIEQVNINGAAPDFPAASCRSAIDPASCSPQSPISRR